MVAKRLAPVFDSIGAFMSFATSSTYSQRRFDEDISDFVFGNPHEMPIAGYQEALQNAAIPQNKDWFAYAMNDPGAQGIVVDSLRSWKGLAFGPEDIFMTSGAFSAIPAILNAVVDAGEEVMYMSPPWFFYEAMILANGAVPVRIKVKPSDFDLDIDAIRNQINEKTRLVIINSPNNPTGRIYPEETLATLGQILSEASEKFGRPVYLLSDEAYSRIVFDERPFPSPVAFYNESFLVYTYGKTHLTPGQRLGYIALNPNASDVNRLRAALLLSQILTGWAFASALMQHALRELEPLSIDIPHLQNKRDRFVEELRSLGYSVHSPEGTFYLLPKSPIEDDLKFTEILANHNTFVLPGAMVEYPGYFRISLTASDEMIDRSFAAFKEAIEEVH